MSGDPWTGYWTQGGRGCLPEGGSRLTPILGRVWQEFGARLRPGARILDLATGGGAVLRALSGCGKRFTLIGVDSAPDLPAAPPGIRLKAGVAMERLPHPAAHFGGITSQFGVEYGDTAAIAAELARVMKPNGALRFVLHHRDGAIVRHNRGRHAALGWALDESGLLERARQLAGARRAARLPTPAWFKTSIQDAARRFPGQSAGVEFATAVAQTLDFGANRPPVETLEILNELQARAEGEIGRLSALERAACDEERCGLIAEQLSAAGLKPSAPQPLLAGDDTIAWLLDATS